MATRKERAARELQLAEERFLKAHGWKKRPGSLWTPDKATGHVFPGDAIFQDNAIIVQKKELKRQ